MKDAVKTVEAHGKRLHGDTFSMLETQLGDDEHLIVCYRVCATGAEDAITIHTQQEWDELLAADLREMLAYFAAPRSYEPY